MRKSGWLQAVLEVAKAQHGAVTRAQLLAAGLSPSAIRRRVAAGALEPVFRGIYLLAGNQGAHARESAALLACGQPAHGREDPHRIAPLLTHVSAAAVWGVATKAPAPAPVHVAGGRRCRRPGIRMHEAPPPADVTRHDGLRLTTPARTLLDLAASLPAGEVEQAYAALLEHRRVTVAELRALLARSAHRHGAPALRRLLDAGPPAFTRSEAERQMLALVREAELPRPRVNAVVKGVEVDFYWPAEQVVLEVDGWEHHKGRESFEEDHDRDLRFERAGVTVVRTTWRQVTQRRVAVATAVGQVLALASRK